MSTPRLNRKSLIGFYLNSSLVISQIAIGIISKSYVTIGDSIDGLIDSFSLIIPLIIIKKKCEHECTNNRELSKTFASLNLGIMVGFRFLLIINVISQYLNPEHISINLANLIIGIIGVIINSSVAFSVGHSHGDNVNEVQDSMILHLLSDVTGSILIIIEYVLWSTKTLSNPGVRTFDTSATLMLSVIMLSLCVRSFIKMIHESKENDQLINPRTELISTTNHGL